ncbi:MAG: hypothetical protein IT445_02745 [Phycisphaeraceae bacterium]|nr:hypothetical protein [Phycisphaeraceae bacterium]
MNRLNVWIGLMVLAGGLLSGGNAQAATAAEALDQVSAEAQIVVLVPQMSDASRKLSAWAQAAGLPQQPGDTLGDFKRSLGIDAGIDDNGSMLVVVQNLQATQEPGGEPDVLLVFPVSDYAAFVSNWQGAAEGVAQLTMPGEETGFARQIGDYAVVAEKRELVEAYTPAGAGQQIIESLGAGGSEVLDGSDAAIYLNLEKAGPTIAAMIEQVMQQVEANMAMSGAPSSQQAQQVFSMYAAAARAVINDSSSILLTMDVADSGIGLHKLVRIKSGSTLAGYFPGGKSTAASQLARLPKQPYIFAASVDCKAIDLAKVYTTMGQQDNAAMQQMLGPAWDTAVELVGKTEVASFVFYTPDQMAMMSGSLMNVLTVVQTADGPAFVGLLRQYMEQLNGMSVPIAPAPTSESPAPASESPAPASAETAPAEGQPSAQPAAPAMTYSTTYKPGALTLSGVSVDQFQIQTVMPPEMMQQMGPMAGFVNAFMSYRGFIASKDKQVVVTTSADPQMVTNTLDVAATAEGIGFDGAIADQRHNNLPGNSAMECYIDLGGIASFANQFITMFGQPPLVVPDGLPPIAMAMSVDGDTLHGRFFVPTTAVQFATASFMQLQAGMNPQQGQPAPGGPAPY